MNSGTNGGVGGICGTQIGGTIQNCYCPAAKSSYIANGGTPDTHCGSLYGWMKGLSASEEIMEEVCLHHNIPCAKIVLANRSSLTYDWTHPNVAGMTEMADQIWNQLKSHLQ